MRVRELVLSDATGGDALRLGFHPRLTVLAGLPGAARRELVETLITASAGGRPDRRLTTEEGPSSAWLETLAPGRPGAELVEELARLDSRLVELDEYEARVAYDDAVARLDAVSVELARVAQLEPSADEDAEILAAAERIDDTQERLTSAVERAERCRRVAAWADALLAGETTEPPSEASSELVDLADRWVRAQQKVGQLERELMAHRADELAPDLDRRVALLAPLDQDLLWETHHRVTQAEARLASAIERRSELEDDLPDELEEAIDSAHIERVRAEELVAARWRPGIVGSGVPAAAGLALALIEASLGGVLVVIGVAVAARLLVGPRVALSRASAAERRELARVGADSYLGLHLRRLAHPDDPDAPQEMEAITRDLDDAARERTAALLSWKELVGRLEPSEADGLETEIRLHAVRFNTALRTETDARIQGELDAARQDLASRADRVSASARDLTERAADLDQQAEAALVELQALLDEHGIEVELDPAQITSAVTEMRATASRRDRERRSLRSRAEVETEHAALSAEVAERERPGWADSPTPPAPRAGSSLLRRRRSEVVRRLADALPSSVDEVRAGAPVVLDEPLAGLEGEELARRLDHVLDHEGQVVYLTDDPAVAGWARDHAEGDQLALIAFGD